MKQAYGFGWREHVRGVTTTFDAVENLAFGETDQGRAAELDAQYAGKIDAGYTLDPAKIVRRSDRKMPDVIVVAANAKGEIVRYFEAGRDGVLLRLAVRARARDRPLRLRPRERA